MGKTMAIAIRNSDSALGIAGTQDFEAVVRDMGKE